MHSFTVNFYQISKEEIMTILENLTKIKVEGPLPKPFYENSIATLSKSKILQDKIPQTNILL